MNDFTQGKIAKQLLLFSVPMLIGNLFQQMYSVVDMIVVGRYISGQSLASVGVSMTMITFIIATVMGLTTGASVVISQFYGAKQYDKLKLTVSVSVLTLLGLSLILTLLGLTLSPVLLRLLKTSEEIFDDALTYLRILSLGMVFPVFYNMYTAYMRALGDSRRPLYFLICTTVLNIILDLFFVVVLKMGVAGAAIATVIAQFVSVLLCFIYATRFMPLLKVNKLVFDKTLFKLIWKYGSPAALQLSFVSFAQLSITRLINSFGPAAMAAITAAARIDQIAMMPVQNLSMALSTFVAQNMGAGLEDRARKGLRTAMLYMLISSVFISVILMVFSRQLVALFVSQDDINASLILGIGSQYLNIMVVFYFLFAFLFAFNGFFRGVGDAVIAMAFPIFSLTLRALSAYGLVNIGGMGPEALAWSIPVGWGLASLTSFIYYKKRLWVGKVAVNKMK